MSIRDWALGEIVMRIAIVGQRDFGKAVLEAFLERGDTVAGVFCAPEKPGARLIRCGRRRAARHPRLPAPSLKTAEAQRGPARLDVDLGVMAYVLQFAPQDFATIPRHGMIQYHPSLLPRYRGPSSINWPIIRGDTRTGLTIFRPTDGLDEGPIILQKETPDRSRRHSGQRVFRSPVSDGDRGPQEAADLVVGGARRGDGAGRVAGELRGLVPRRRSPDQLAQSHRSDPQPHPRLRSGAGRVDALQGQETACSTRASIPREPSGRSRGTSARSPPSASRACA